MPRRAQEPMKNRAARNRARFVTSHLKEANSHVIVYMRENGRLQIAKVGSERHHYLEVFHSERVVGVYDKTITQRELYEDMLAAARTYGIGERNGA